MCQLGLEHNFNLELLILHHADKNRTKTMQSLQKKKINRINIVIVLTNCIEAITNTLKGDTKVQLLFF